MFEQKSGDRIGNVNSVLWWGGWRPLASFAISLILSFAVLYNISPSLGFVVGLLGGAAWWFAGVRTINENYSEILREYARYTENAAESLLNLPSSDTESYRLASSSGTAFQVKPSKRFYSTTLLVGDTSVAIHEGVGLDMVKRVPYLDDNTRELYYDQIASVSYRHPFLEITTSNGDTLEYQSTREPDDALTDLQQRLREYKKQTATGSQPA